MLSDDLRHLEKFLNEMACGSFVANSANLRFVAAVVRRALADAVALEESVVAPPQRVAMADVLSGKVAVLASYRHRPHPALCPEPPTPTGGDAA